MKEANKEKVDLELQYGAATTLITMFEKVLHSELDSCILKQESEDLLKERDFVATQALLLGYRKGIRYALTLLSNRGDSKDD